jgi:phage terminase large subunit
MEEIELLDTYGPLFDTEPDTRYFVITGGRGSGKSWSVALSLLNQTDNFNEVILFTRWTLTSAFISIIPEFIEKIELMKRE